jgi:hypothetical protein
LAPPQVAHSNPVSNTNPFFSPAPASTAAAPTTSKSDFDDFDALVNARHGSAGAATMPVPLQPFGKVNSQSFPATSPPSTSSYPAPTAHPPLNTNFSTNVYPTPTLASTAPSTPLSVLTPSSSTSSFTPSSAAYHAAPITPTVLTPTPSTLTPTSTASTTPTRPLYPSPSGYGPATPTYAPVSSSPGYTSGYPAAPSYASGYPAAPFASQPASYPGPGVVGAGAGAAPFMSTSPTGYSYPAPGYAQPGYGPPLNPPSYSQLGNPPYGAPNTSSYRPQ